MTIKNVHGNTLDHLGKAIVAGRYPPGTAVPPQTWKPINRVSRRSRIPALPQALKRSRKARKFPARSPAQEPEPSHTVSPAEAGAEAELPAGAQAQESAGAARPGSKVYRARIIISI